MFEFVLETSLGTRRMWADTVEEVRRDFQDEYSGVRIFNIKPALVS